MGDWSGAVKVELKWKMFGDKQDKSKLEDCSGKNRNPLQRKYALGPRQVCVFREEMVYLMLQKYFEAVY